MHYPFLCYEITESNSEPTRLNISETIVRYDSQLFAFHTPFSWPSQSLDFSKKVSILSSQLHFVMIQLIPEYSGLTIHWFGDILVGPRMKTHGCCERHSPRPEKQIITPRVALCRRSIILFYLYIYLYFKQYNYRMYQTQEVSILIYITCNYFQLSKSNWKSFGSITELKLLKQSSGTTPTPLFFINLFLDCRNPWN